MIIVHFVFSNIKTEGSLPFETNRVDLYKTHFELSEGGKFATRWIICGLRQPTIEPHTLSLTEIRRRPGIK